MRWTLALILNLLLLSDAMAFGWKRSITVDHTKVPSTQSNFAILINSTDAGLKSTGNGGHVQSSSGFDIRPYSDSGLTTALTYQLESYDAVGGTVVMWVSISSLSSASDTVIWLAYGDNTLTTDGSSTSTWDSNYKAVWHMNDNAANTTIKEFTSAAVNATNVANTSGKTIAGQVGNALTYNGSSDASSVALDLSGSPIITLSFWLKWTTFAADDHLAFEYSANYNSNNGFIVDPNDSGTGAFEMGYHSTSEGAYWTDHFTRPSGNTWHLYHLVIDRTNKANKAYVDGTSQTMTATNHGITGTGNFDNSTLYWMSRATTSLFADGKLDEVRVSNVERSADWVTTEWNNQNSPSTFYTLGAETAIGGGAAVSGFFFSST